MRWFTEFIVLYPEMDIPDEETFFPSFWKHPEFGVKGNYYFYGAEGKWTELEISQPVAGGRSVCSVYSYRKDNMYASSLLEVEDLKRFIEYHAAGRYLPGSISPDAPVAVSAFYHDSPVTDHYPEFLETVAHFMEQVDGLLVNHIQECDAKGFRAYFMG